jgi:hypothetical protein
MSKIIPLLIVALCVCTGCDKKSDTSLAGKAGEKVGKTVTDFASGVGKGIDTQMTVNVELAPGLTEAGVTRTLAKSEPLSKSISVYFVSSKPFTGRLLAKALNAEGQEIGRAFEDLSLGQDDAKYVAFKFPEEMDTRLVSKYIIDARR